MLEIRSREMLKIRSREMLEIRSREMLETRSREMQKNRSRNSQKQKKTARRHAQAKTLNHHKRTYKIIKLKKCVFAKKMTTSIEHIHMFRPF